MRRSTWLLVVVAGALLWPGAWSPAQAQIIGSTTTTTEGTTTTTLLPPTSRSTTTTTGSTSTTRRTTTTTGTDESTSTSRGPTTSTTQGETTTTFTILPGPTTLPDEPAAGANPGGTGEINPVFPSISVLAFLVAFGLMGRQWLATRQE